MHEVVMAAHRLHRLRQLEKLSRKPLLIQRRNWQRAKEDTRVARLLVAMIAAAVVASSLVQ